MCGDLLLELDLDPGRPTVGGEVGLEPTRKLVLIAAHREAEDHSNVTSITLQLCKFDCLSTA
jgi:hypothetical protein